MEEQLLCKQQVARSIRVFSTTMSSTETEPRFFSVRRTWQILAKDEAEAARAAVAEGRLVLLEVEAVPIFHYEEQAS